MSKIFRLAKAELNKIFYRPSIFILTALLIIILILTNLLYSPTQNTIKLSYSGQSVSAVYQQFKSSANSINKSSIDNSFETLFKQIEDQFDSIAKDDKLKNLQDRVYAIYSCITNDLKEDQISASTGGMASFVATFNELKQMCSDLMSYLATLKGETLNFYFTISEYNTIFNEIEKLYDVIPQNSNASNTPSYFINLANTIRQNYTIPSSRQIVSNLEKLSIDIDTYNELIQTYYTNAKQTLNDVYNKQIEDFIADNDIYQSTDEDDISQINEYIAQYNSYAQMNMTLLENKFMLLRIGDKSDTELKNLIGYNEVSKYALNEKNKIYDYLLENNDFEYNYLTSFNFNVASGATSNAYDYTVYSMQILSVLIIVFTIFYACSSIAGDQSSGTMKMIAIRPYTRNKLFSGKFLSCLMFGIMLTIISTIASFVVGSVMYGLPTTQCLVVFNASSVISIHPALLLILYLFSLVVNLLFYISLSMLICLLFKSNTLSVFLTTIIYATQVVLNGLIGGAWLKYTPFGHFDLFKYFGNSKLGMLSMNILPDSNFLTSAIVLGLMIVVFNALSHLIFKRRDIT